MLVVNQRIAIPSDELRFSYSTSSGPGGQHVNKVSTKATLHWNVARSRGVPDDVKQRFLSRNRRRINLDGDLVMSSQRYRDRSRNVADCEEKLKVLLLEVAVAPKKRKATRPSRRQVEKRLKQKKQRSEKKQSRRSSFDD